MPEEGQDASASVVGLAALTESGFKTVEAIAGRIIPATDMPGAVEAGSAHYIEQALAGPYGGHLPRYRQGIAELDRHCTGRFGKPFAALGAAQQDEILAALEAGRIGDVADGARFFDLVRVHVMEGFFCEPHYGGNRGLVGWKLVGFPGQRFGYDDPYINRMVDLDPVAHDGPPPKGA